MAVSSYFYPYQRYSVVFDEPVSAQSTCAGKCESCKDGEASPCGDACKGRDCAVCSDDQKPPKKECDHKWVDIGVIRPRWVCKKCDIEMEKP